jgi:hypothetical protein
MDDERLKLRAGGNYFEELLARIRDIRSSEKVFWRKVLEIYATSIDYTRRHNSCIAESGAEWVIESSSATPLSSAFICVHLWFQLLF